MGMKEILSSIEGEWRRYKVLGEGALRQLHDDELGKSGPGNNNSIAVIVQTEDQRSSAPIALDAAVGQIIVATQGPGDCRVTIEPGPAR